MRIALVGPYIYENPPWFNRYSSLTSVLLPAETAKERVHEKVVAEAPPTDSSEQLAAQQIDKSYSSLKAALAGMIKSRKKGDLNAFALDK